MNEVRGVVEEKKVVRSVQWDNCVQRVALAFTLKYR